MTMPSRGPLVHEDESAYAFAGTGQLLGTNELDKIVTRFSQAVSQLDDVVSAAAQSYRGGLFGAASTPSAGGGFSGLLNAVPGFTAHRPGAGGGGAGAAGFGVLLPGGGGGGWYAGGGGAAAPPPGGGMPAPAGPGGGAPGAPRGGGGMPGGGAGPGGGGGGGFASLLLGAFTFGVGAMYRGVSSFGQSSLPSQLVMSRYLQQQMAFSSQNTWGSRQGILNQAFGANAMAASPQDAAVGQAILNAISGTTSGSAPGYAQPLAQGAASYNALLNYPNGLNYAQSAGLTSSLMSPQTSMRFYMAGLGGASPLQLGGGVNTNAAGMFESINQRFMPGFTANAQGLQKLRYNMRSGGVLRSDIENLTGLSGQNLESFISSDLYTSKLQSEGLSTQRINQLFQQAGQGNRSAQDTLEKYGLPLSDIQAQKNVQAQKTAGQADIEQSFSKGLQDASDSLTKFNQIVNDFLKSPFGQLFGTVAGWTGESKAQGTVTRALTGGVLGVAGSVAGGIGHFFSHAFGGGAAAPGQKSSQKTSGQTHKSTTAGTGVPAQAAQAVKSAESQIGVPYVWGGEQPGSGFDCSGLVQWAYEQAGVALPRTSQAQWAYLKKRQVALDKVQEGDILFSAGSDGTASAPGHEALVVSSRQIIQAPFSGQNVQVDPFDSAQWLYAARPAGSLNGSAGGTAGGSTSSSNNQGNAGKAPVPSAGMGLGTGSYGSSEEMQNIQSALLGGISAGAPATGGGVSSAGGNAQSASTSRGGSSAAKGGTAGQNQAIAKKLMASFGWDDKEWAPLLALWQRESGWSQYADTRKSGLDPAGAAVFAYGIAQARPYSKMPKAGWPADKGGKSNAGVQETWGMQYIRDTYHDPAGAWQHEQQVGWYETGTRSARKGYAVVGERGPELMKLAGGEQIISAGQAAHLAMQDLKRPPSHPYKNLLDTVMSLPDSDTGKFPVAAAGTGSKPLISLTFSENSICLGQGVTSQDARNFVKLVAQAVRDDATIQAIASGVLHG